MFSLQGKDTSKPAGIWFQLLMVLFTKEYLPTSVFCFLVPIFPIMIIPTQVAWFENSIPCRFPSPSPGVCTEKGAYAVYQIFAVPKFPNPTPLYYSQI